MITCVNFENLDECGAILHSQFTLRYKQFIERQSYDVKSYNGMEFDQYDTPATSYLVYHDDRGHALATSRLMPTTHGCMLQDIFPQMVENKTNLISESIWEGTRYCMDKSIPREARRHIINEMALAYIEFGLAKGLKKIVGMMPTIIYHSVFERPGIEMEYLGDIHLIDGMKCRAVAIPVTVQQLLKVRQKTNIDYSTLRFSLGKTRQLYGQAA